jgi:hypothetical protein
MVKEQYGIKSQKAGEGGALIRLNPISNSWKAVMLHQKARARFGDSAVPTIQQGSGRLR